MKSAFGLAVFLIALLMISGGVHAQEPSFVLLYNFDEGEGDVVKDLSEKGNDGSIANCEWTADGKFGGGIEFDGASSVIEVPHNDSLNPGGDQITVMAWYKPFSLTASYPPIARKGSVAEKGWGFDIPTNTLRAWVINEAQQGILTTGANALELEVWQHVAMVYDGEEIRAYINGELDGSVECSGDINENEGSLWIAKKADESQYLHGVMDELAILNIALTEEQISTYMKEGVKTAVEALGKLVATWGKIKIQ